MSPDILSGGFATLGSDINKQKIDPQSETKEGVVSDKLPELELTTNDEELIKLSTNWERIWKASPKKEDWDKQGEENENYWLGKQFDIPRANKDRAMVDNLIFESAETYLPQVTRRNPEPLVMLDSTEIPKGGEPNPEHLLYVEKVKDRLSDLADVNKLRLKLKKAARHWMIYLIGIVKFGWDLDRDIPTMRIIRPKKIILDPDATIDEDGYTGDRIGEYRKLPASRILDIIGNDEKSKAVKKINELVEKDEKGTDIQFIEWWTPELFFWKLGDTILIKKKNPHWNYDKTETSTDEFGKETENDVPTLGINHLPIPEMPYKFLTVFNLGDQPMDKTSLIGQNLSNQDLINKRNRQIDKNADRMNGGLVVSLERSGLTQPQAKGVSEALRKGGVVVIPKGAPRDAIDDYAPTALPNDIFNQLADTRARLRDIFGTTGTTPSSIQKEKTLGGKILTRGLDTDRIGGGVSEYLEQLSDDIYNWILQLLYVYDSGFQFIGDARPPKLIISVKEGSLLPKDSLAIANQAIELASINRMSNIDLYKRLEYPNPDEIAANTWLEQNAPHLLYKDNPLVQEAIAQQQQAQAQATADEQGKEQQKHAQEMEKEKLKSDGRKTLPAKT